MKRRTALIVMNVLVILALVTYVLFFSFSQRAHSLRNQEKAFVSTVQVMEQVSSNYLLSSQKVCDNWAQFLNAGQFTMEQAMGCLGDMNADEHRSIQLLRADKLTGLSSVPKTLAPDDYSVTYTERYNTLYDELRGFAAADDPSEKIHITRNFNNPVNGDFVVAFCNRVTLYDEAGGSYQALVLLLDQLDRIKESWVFPVGYSNAQTAIIDADGEYIIRADSMKSENFYEFIRAYNGLTYPQSDALRDKVNQSGGGSFEYRNAGGQETFCAYTHITGNGGWLLVGEIPVSSLNGERVQWSLVVVTCLAFAVLIFLNGNYVLALNRRLAASLKDAENANRAKTNFLSSMSHDIRTPMNAIVGMTAIAQRNVDDREQVRDCLGKIELASNHLLTLINDILDISRVESGKVKLNPSEFSLADAMQNLVNILYPQIMEKGLDFDVHLSGLDEERIFADELRINQIWINILSNAVKYTRSGGRVVLTLRQERLPGDSGSIRLVYQVSDTGIGMSEDFLRTIYDPFTRAEDSRTDSIQGSGLGMAITKQMVDLMGGTIDVKSELGKGSTFTVSLILPLAQDRPERQTFSGLRILVADRDPDVLREAGETLAAMGAEADSASAWDEAEAAVLRGRREGRAYDAVLLDSRLSGPDGTPAAEFLRREGGAGSTAVVLASYDSSEGPGADRSAEAFRIIKPYFRSVLQKTLELLLHPAARQEAPKMEKRFLGLSVLVAEDNDLNWEILDRMLSFYGIVAKRAKNGQACVEILQHAAKGQYRLIFMDVQMPVMNGYDATRAIRAMADREKAQLPIVAMTADAFAEDVENCKKAGMNGHLSKPINIDRVLAEIEKYTGREE